MRRVRVLPLCLAAALVTAAAPVAVWPMGGARNNVAVVPAGDATYGQKLATMKCAACHGPDGNSTVPQYPKLAGQNPTYLYNQLLAFKAGARKSEVMAPIITALSDADAADLARFYSEQTPKPDPITDRALADAGERIFDGGRRMPSCAMCHIPGQRMPITGMMGVNPADIPTLAGQHAAYTLSQLDAYASGQRSNGVMTQYAASLSAADRKAVATYLASLR